jgi:hypothetical protein
MQALKNVSLSGAACGWVKYVQSAGATPGFDFPVVIETVK